jgi:hypothetical protein
VGVQSDIGLRMHPLLDASEPSEHEFMWGYPLSSRERVSDFWGGWKEGTRVSIESMKDGAL